VDPIIKGSSQEQNTEIPRRLVVELTRRSADAMAWLVDEEELNKTTLVNRAVQVYKLVIEAQKQGRKVMLSSPDGSEAEVLWIV
jgi:hypothetical protein